MRQDEYLYHKLTEECAEVQQRVCKLLLFGPDERQDTAPTNLRGASVPPGTNIQRLAGEVKDLQIIIHLLGFAPPTSEEIVAKQAKLEKYFKYAKDLGRIDDPYFDAEEATHGNQR